VWATIGWRAPRLLKLQEKSFEAVLKRYPHNSALALAESNYRLLELDKKAQLQATTRAIAASPKLEMAWAQLSSIYSQQAYDIRGARYSGDMTAAESAQVQALYPKAFSAALHAASLNRETSYSWLQAAKAATFDGNRLSRTLLWRAMQADPDDSDVYNWGLQMFQPKWGGNTNDLLKVVAVARNNAEVLPWLVDDIKLAYDAASISERFGPIPGRAVSLLQKEVAKKPNNAFIRGQLATLLTSTHQPKAAIAQLQQCAKLWPDSANPLLRIAATYADPMRDYANADKWYSAALTKETNNSSTLLEVADYYKNERRNYEKSSPLYRRAIKLDATNINAIVGLANVEWFLKNDKKTGGALFRKAVAMPNNDGSANEEYAWALMRNGQRDAAIVQAQKSLKRGRYGHPVFKELGLQ
jgi:Tfp pilus assembly protein PilF